MLTEDHHCVAAYLDHLVLVWVQRRFDRWMDALDMKRAHGRDGVAEMGAGGSRLLGLVRRG